MLSPVDEQESRKLREFSCSLRGLHIQSDVRIAYDPAKNERNIRERGLAFDQAADFDFSSATIITQIRNGETRRVATGYLENRLHVLCYIPMADGIRVISFRKANKREAKRCGKTQTTD